MYDASAPNRPTPALPYGWVNYTGAAAFHGGRACLAVVERDAPAGPHRPEFTIRHVVRWGAGHALRRHGPHRGRRAHGDGAPVEPAGRGGR
jgi:hypothetical protein